jgi:hypothetical protein
MRLTGQMFSQILKQFICTCFYMKQRFKASKLKQLVLLFGLYNFVEINAASRTGCLFKR